MDPEGRRHTRRRIPLAEAVDVAGGGERGRALITRLAGERARDGGRTEGPLRLITVTEDGGDREPAAGHDRWVNLIHETLIRSKGLDAEGKPRPYWPTLWTYIEQHKDRAARRERLLLQAREWKDRTGLSRLGGLAGWSSLFGFRGLAAAGVHRAPLSSLEPGAAGVEIAPSGDSSRRPSGTVCIGRRRMTNRIRRWRPIGWAYKLGIRKLPLPALAEKSRRDRLG